MSRTESSANKARSPSIRQKRIKRTRNDENKSVENKKPRVSPRKKSPVSDNSRNKKMKHRGSKYKRKADNRLKSKKKSTEKPKKDFTLSDTSINCISKLGCLTDKSIFGDFFWRSNKSAEHRKETYDHIGPVERMTTQESKILGFLHEQELEAIEDEPLQLSTVKLQFNQQVTASQDSQVSEFIDCRNFNDGVRRIDFVLVFKKDRNLKAKQARSYLLTHLNSRGIEHEYESCDEVTFIKLHATVDFLFHAAEIMEIKLPFCPSWQSKIIQYEETVRTKRKRDADIRQKQREQHLKKHFRLASEEQKTSSTESREHMRKSSSRAIRDTIEYTAYGVTHATNRLSIRLVKMRDSLMKKFEIQNHILEWNRPWVYSAPYRAEEDEFFIQRNDDEEQYQNTRSKYFDEPMDCGRERIRMVAYELEQIGLSSYIYDKVLIGAFPLHDDNTLYSKNKGSTSLGYSIRSILHANWARFTKMFTMTPVDIVQSYFGEQVALYFAFLTLYTEALVYLSLLGLMTFTYGLVYVNSSNDDIADVCNEKNMTICPSCDKGCPFYGASSNCFGAQIAHMFDNRLAIIYGCGVSLWGVIFMEFWKRRQCVLATKWLCSERADNCEVVRPEYIKKADGNVKYRAGTLAYEIHVPLRARYSGIFASFISVLFFLSLVIAAVISCMFFNLWLSARYLPRNHELSQFDGTALESYWKYDYIINSGVSCLLCLFLIILDFLYNIFAHTFTKWECPRTQAEYDSSYSFKLFCFYFVNYYSWPFYIAFIKDNVIGTPPEYNRIFGYKWQGCGPSGCQYEITMQLVIVMVLKPIFLNILHIVLPKFLLFLSRARYNPEKTQKNAWEANFVLLPENNVSYDYIEMAVQFGFITLFSSAFPLAPIFAALNNFIEIRRDAQKYTKYTQRPVPKRVKSIGIWQNIFQFLAGLSVATNVMQIAFTSECINKWVYYNDFGTLSGYMRSQYSLFNVTILGEYGLDLDAIPNNENHTMCYVHVLGSYNEETKSFEYKKEFYRIWVFKLVFAFFFTVLIYIAYWFIEWVIPDMPERLANRCTQEKYILNAKRDEIRLKRLKVSRSKIMSTSELSISADPSLQFTQEALQPTFMAHKAKNTEETFDLNLLDV